MFGALPEAIISEAAELLVLLIVVGLLIGYRHEIRRLLDRATHLSIGPFTIEVGDLRTAVVRRTGERAANAERLTRPVRRRYARIAGDCVGRKLLWVDDNPDWNQYEREFFNSLGIQIDLAGSNADARRMVQDRTYDIIVTDLAREAEEAADDPNYRDGDGSPGMALARSLALSGSTPVIIYAGEIHDWPISPKIFGLTNSPVELAHLVADAIERRVEG